jgi:hypothetical protein
MKINDWTTYSDEELLDLRIKDLGLDLQTSPLHGIVQNVLNELVNRNLHFSPRVYLGDEWFSPSNICAVAIPFFLAHPRLRTLEKRIMLECEGEDAEDFERLLRHELGHAFDHAFNVSKRKSWQKVFGSPQVEYKPESYRPQPYSRNFVQNIPQWYAQSHPDEDFAETFAVWLNPKSNWKDTYKDWGALKKLYYVETLCAEFREKSVPAPKGRMISDARHLQSTLRHYYEQKKKVYAENYPDFYDSDLLTIFDYPKQNDPRMSAHAFMRFNRREIIQTISKWTGEKKVTVAGLVSRLTHRCRELKIVLATDEKRTLILLSSFLTTLVSHYLFTGHFRRKV